MKGIRLEEKTWEEAAKAIEDSGGVAILPIGSVEQHGKHLPLGTDSYVAQGISEAASAATGAVLIPPMWFGWCPHHMVLPGTVTIRPEILIEYLYDVLGSLSAHGLKKVVLVNGHRIVNIVWMQIAAQKAQEAFGIRAVIFDPAYMSKEIVSALDFGPVGHAEEIETSHMLHMHEHIVHMDRAIDNPVKKTERYSVDPSYALDTLCYVPSRKSDQEKHAKEWGGTSGSPTKADKNKGEQYHDHLVQRMVEVIEELRRKDV